MKGFNNVAKNKMFLWISHLRTALFQKPTRICNGRLLHKMWLLGRECCSFHLARRGRRISRLTSVSLRSRVNLIIGGNMERRILLKKALDILDEIDRKMKESTGDPWQECPFCMGELFYEEERQTIEAIRKYLNGIKK